MREPIEIDNPQMAKAALQEQEVSHGVKQNIMTMDYSGIHNSCPCYFFGLGGIILQLLK